METVPLDAAHPYALITAGESVHWMDWDVVFPRIRAALNLDGVLAVVERQELPPPWAEDLRRLLPAFSTNVDFTPYDPIDEIVERGHLDLRGRHVTAPYSFFQPTEAHIEAMHSRNGFSRARMGPEPAAAFDADYRGILEAHGAGHMVEVRVQAEVCWGLPTG